MTTSAAKDFSKATITKLRKRGIRITGSTWLPSVTGGYSNGERGYLLDDNGTGRIRTLMQVLKLAESPESPES